MAKFASRPLAAQSQPSGSDIFLERPATGQPHKGKVLLALQAHSDDIPLSAAGTVAKLIEEGYTGYLVRATNDDMGDAPGLGTSGSIGENALHNEQDNEEIARVLGCKRTFNLNYNNHRMADISLNELISRLIFIIRFVKADTVVCWDPWAHDEENPDHYMLARGVEAACWMAGRSHDYEEQFAAGLEPHAVADKYYFARRPEITRVVDISAQIDKKERPIAPTVRKDRLDIWDPGCVPNWQRGASACRCWATATMRAPIETILRNSVCAGAASWVLSTESNMQKPFTTWPREARAREQIQRLKTTSNGTQYRLSDLERQSGISSSRYCDSYDPASRRVVPIRTGA